MSLESVSLPVLVGALSRFVTWHVHEACLDTADALVSGDQEQIDAFLFALLFPKEVRAAKRALLPQALWEVLRSGRWAMVEREPLRFLRCAIKWELRHLRSPSSRATGKKARDDMAASEDRQPRGDVPVAADEERPGAALWEGDRDRWEHPEAWVAAGERVMAHRCGSPLALLGVPQVPIRLRAAIDDIRASAMPENQRRLLKMLEDGVSPASAIEQLGGSWSPWQALNRKIGRRLKISA